MYSASNPMLELIELEFIYIISSLIFMHLPIIGHALPDCYKLVVMLSAKFEVELAFGIIGD